MTNAITRRTAISGIAGIAALPWLPHVRAAAAVPPKRVYSPPMQEALRSWISHRNEYLEYGVAPMARLGMAEQRAFLDEPWPGYRAMAIARLVKHTDRLLFPTNWYRYRDDAEALCWMLDQFYTPQRLPSSDWALEHYSDWSEQAFQVIYMAYASWGEDIPDRHLDRMSVWHHFTHRLASQERSVIASDAMA